MTEGVNSGLSIEQTVPIVKDAELAASRVRFIDGLRAIAALSVLVFHLVAYFGREYGSSAGVPFLKAYFLNGVDFGMFGVALFFFVSGYVIPYSLFNGGLKKFTISRLSRLYPPFWAAVVLVMVVESIFHGAHYTVSDTLANLTMMPKLLGVEYYSGVFWSLQIEVYFYVICAVLCCFGWRGGLRTTAGLTVLMGIGCCGPKFVNAAFGLHLPVIYTMFHLSFLFCGNVIRNYFEGEEGRGNRLIVFAVLAFQAVVIFIGAGGYWGVPHALGLFSASSTLLAFYGAMALFIFGVVTRKPGMAWLAHMGRSSYSLYLMHWPIGIACMAGMKALGLNSPLPLFVAAVTGSILLCELSYRLIELPAISTGRMLVNRWAPKAARMLCYR
jgi:peptidoglycan/LPS O-acetylase OafA/YrhL